MSSGDTKVTKIGILSMGDMGVGIAKLLAAHGFLVATNCQGRSEDTIARAKTANVELLPSDLELVKQCPFILSVVPPRDAEATAQRVADALSGGSRADSIFFIDLNAVSPSTAKGMAKMFEKARVPVKFIDGCILGAPPRLAAAADTLVADSLEESEQRSGWTRPNIPISGSHSLSSLQDGETLAKVLNFRSISPDIGAASGLKMCFAAIAKGFTALATQSFTTAHQLGVAGELKRELGEMFPNYLATAEKSVPNMLPKAYRWVKEMEEISDTMHDEGGWAKELFQGIAGVYKAVAGDPVLGKEKIGKRVRGTSLEEVSAMMGESLEKKRKKMQ
ncbi:6-phosphogluconate dehydrogenase, NAD-binding protein [Metarhizium rileyi]|uniref:6-phosphogluconate dehydrogenase, NAD-binding protein n=1 Tax=Metarhizium rileyi (strain RCEF 4871) TaxID=1649241 RepID=A0A162HTU8_METRR|nr:6-phosphogluconate dehydrogenase, NAD-binding protein [Metarhizium rileyi RCEF 4871]